MGEKHNQTYADIKLESKVKTPYQNLEKIKTGHSLSRNKGLLKEDSTFVLKTKQSKTKTKQNKTNKHPNQPTNKQNSPKYNKMLFHP